MEAQTNLETDEYNPKNKEEEEENEKPLILPETEEIARKIDFGPDPFKAKMTEIKDKIKE